MKTLLFVILTTLATISFAQKSGEKLIYSFKTQKGKTMSLTLDTVNNVMIYRYGTKNKTELEKKDVLYNDEDIFTYSYYFRGGPGNAGLDLNYVTFTNKDFKYKIYDEYSAEDDSRDAGIKLINLKTGKKYNIPALKKSIKGDLSVIRNEEYIPVEEVEE